MLLKHCRGFERTEAVHLHQYKRSKREAAYQSNSGGFDVNGPGRRASDVCHQQEWFLCMNSLQCFKLGKKKQPPNPSASAV